MGSVIYHLLRIAKLGLANDFVSATAPVGPVRARACGDGWCECASRRVASIGDVMMMSGRVWLEFGIIKYSEVHCLG